MKTLKESILSKVGGGDKYFERELEKWGLDPKKIIRNKDGSFDYIGELIITNDEIKELTELPIKFNKVTGGFYIINCHNLITLKDCPQEIHGAFAIFNCDGLKSLEGGPTMVTGDGIVEYCKSLKSLKGLPKEINGSLKIDNIGTKVTVNNIEKYCKVKGDIQIQET